MKSFALILASALAMFSTASATASDSYYGHGGHHGYASHGFAAPTFGQGFVQLGYIGHGYAVPALGHGFAQHGYEAPVFSGYNSYRSYGHGSGLQISTPHFGLRFSH